jgi:hypothetical protein
MIRRKIKKKIKKNEYILFLVKSNLTICDKIIFNLTNYYQWLKIFDHQETRGNQRTSEEEEGVVSEGEEASEEVEAGEEVGVESSRQGHLDLVYFNLTIKESMMEFSHVCDK